MKIYGPYIRKDGRKHIIIIEDNGKRKTKSYPRYLMEMSIGRNLTEFETVDHINEDFTDDRLENLQILSRSENVSKSSLLRPAKIFEFSCPMCGKYSQKPEKDVRRNRKLGKSGPFCGRTCAGKYKKSIICI